jgi:hypothetical protein
MRKTTQFKQYLLAKEILMIPVAMIHCAQKSSNERALTWWAAPSMPTPQL